MNIKEMNTQKLVIYAELLTGMVNEMDGFGRKVTQAKMDDYLTDSEMQEIHKDLMAKITMAEEARIELVKELSTRIKKDLSIRISPTTVHDTLRKYQEKYPYIGMSKAELEYLETEKKAKAKKEGKIVKLDT